MAARQLDGLIESNLGFAHAIAADILKRMPAFVDRADLDGASELGLVEAANSFREDRGVNFRTFAYYRCRGSVFDYLRKNGWLSRAEYRKFRFERAANDLMLEQADSPAEAASMEDVRALTQTVISCYFLSLDEMPDVDARDMRPSPEERYQKAQMLGRLRRAVERLPERNRKMITDYFILERGLQEIGDDLGCSKSWASRLLAKSLEMLRETMAGLPSELTGEGAGQ
jgi:RNA polymerase sigma factor for flagellar operon FliA